MRVLVLGGYGNFGRIICRRLQCLSALEVIVAGRSADGAAAFARELGIAHLALDAADPQLAVRLRESRIDLVISTAGPFQQQDYRVPQACIEARAHYIDIADARRYVCDIVRLDAAARERDVLVLSGASSVPTLSSAVVNEYLGDFSRLTAIEHGICASERLPGEATVAAVLSYCGEPFPVWDAGGWRAARGWQDLRRVRLPAPLGSRWFANCDVPDLELFPQRYPGVERVRFQAGLGLPVTQWGLWLLAGLRRARLVPRVDGLASSLRWSGQRLEPFGDGVSGMFVHLRGLDRSRQSLERRWHLVVENNEGPSIPCLAAVALTRKLASGQLSMRGAAPAVGVLTLSEYLAELAGMPFRVATDSAR